MISKIILLKKIDRIIGRGVVKFLGIFLKVKPGGKPFPRQEVKRILVIRPGGLGDAVLLIPMLTAVRKRFKGVVIDVLAEKRNGEIFLCGQKRIDRLFLYDRGLDLLRVMFRTYDLVIDTEQFHYLSGLVAFLIRAGYRVGFETAERGVFFHQIVEYSEKDYEVHSFLHLLEAITGEPQSFDPNLPFHFMEENGLQSNLMKETPRISSRILIAPGAMNVQRQWGWKKFRNLTHRLLNKGFEIVLIGSSLDRAESKEIAKGISGSIIDKTGETNLNELWKLIQGADLLICNDTGVLHMAYAVGTPSVSLFGAGIEAKWAPKGKQFRSINVGMSCSPCTHLGVTPPCPIDVACMDAISVDEVEEKAIDLLEKYQSHRIHSRENPE